VRVAGSGSVRRGAARSVEGDVVGPAGALLLDLHQDIVEGMMAIPMDRLADVLEHLDGPLTDPHGLQGNLRDLRRINRWLGGVRLSRRACEALLAGAGRPHAAGPGGETRPVDPLRLLDVGTGGADIPVALIHSWRRRGLEVRVTGLDSRPEVLMAALAERPALRDVAELSLVEGDGRAVPFGDATFDIAHASLLLHHLEPPDAADLLREMARVSTMGIVVNDLARGRLAWLGAWLLVHVATSNRFTRHDGPLSVRRAYTLGEARRLVEAAGLRVMHEEAGFLGHRWAIAARA
jgi:ubiquinone/menaquinone biosynthesis C-methylase UbiE